MTRRRIVAGLLVSVGLLTLLYLADVALASGDVPRGTRVAGVAIGGKSRSAALRLLASRVQGPKQVTVTGPAGTQPLVIDPAGVGLRVDPARTLDAAREQSLNPVVRLASLFTKHDVRPVVTVDANALHRAVQTWAATADHSAREGSVRFDGVTPVAVPPRPGVVVDVERTSAAIVAAYPLHATVGAVVTTTPVKTSAADVASALHGIADRAVAAPVTLRAPDHDLTMTPAQIATVLRIDAGPDGRIAPRLDEKALATTLAETLRPVETPPKDAPITVDDQGAVHIGESAPGKTVDRHALATSLLTVLAQPAPRSVDLTLTDAEPRVSTTLAKTLGIKQKVSEFTTYHPCCRARVVNIHHIADIVNGAVVLPGETFSLNGYVGPRDTKRGFVMAPMILDGKFVPAVGGGVSQFATTMFNAVFFGGFADVYHKPHSYYISRYPAGREATVSTPSPDLQWKNDSPYGVLVTTKYTEKSVTVAFWSTKRYDIESVSGERYRIKPTHTVYDSRPTCESAAGESGFDIDVWRVFKVDGKETRREKFHTRYLPEPHFVCGSAPSSPSPSPSPSPSASPG
jgi:vancomycin resistance protein YoaR